MPDAVACDIFPECCQGILLVAPVLVNRITDVHLEARLLGAQAFTLRALVVECTFVEVTVLFRVCLRVENLDASHVARANHLALDMRALSASVGVALPGLFQRRAGLATTKRPAEHTAFVNLGAAVRGLLVGTDGSARSSFVPRRNNAVQGATVDVALASFGQSRAWDTMELACLDDLPGALLSTRATCLGALGPGAVRLDLARNRLVEALRLPTATSSPLAVNAVGSVSLALHALSGAGLVSELSTGALLAMMDRRLRHARGAVGAGLASVAVASSPEVLVLAVRALGAMSKRVGTVQVTFAIGAGRAAGAAVLATLGLVLADGALVASSGTSVELECASCARQALAGNSCLVFAGRAR